MKTIDKNTPIKMAFLGCGFATKIHSKTLSGFDNVHCYYASRSLEKSKEYNEKYTGSGAFGSYDAAIDSPDINVIFIATPPASHLELAQKALQAGKHVIVEKPPFFNSTDFDIVKSLGEKNGCQIMVAENYFYKPSLQKIRGIIADGLIGDVLFIHINALKMQKIEDWRDDLEQSGGGALFEGGIHWVNYLANMGLEIVDAQGLQPAKIGDYEKSILVTAKYREGAVATLQYSWEVPSLFKGLRISRIFGREGSVTFESNGIFIFVRGKKKKLIFPGISDIAGYKGMFEDFFQALRNGESPQFSLDLAKRDLQLIETIYQTETAMPSV